MPLASGAGTNHHTPHPVTEITPKDSRLFGGSPHTAALPVLFFFLFTFGFFDFATSSRTLCKDTRSLD